jgi:hypothetical protein
MADCQRKSGASSAVHAWDLFCSPAYSSQTFVRSGLRTNTERKRTKQYETSSSFPKQELSRESSARFPFELDLNIACIVYRNWDQYRAAEPMKDFLRGVEAN